MDNKKFILFIGSVITLLLGFLSAFIPELAYMTVSTEGLNSLLSSEPYYVTVQPLIFSFNAFTIRLLVSAFGGLLCLCSIFFERKNSIPFLSFTGLSLGTIGFLLPYGSTQQVVNNYSTAVPWIGSLITLVGVLLMFLGFSLKNTHVPKLALCVIPMLLIVYLISPVLIFTGNFQLFMFLQVNIVVSTTIGLVILLGHLIIVWAGITGLHIPEKESAAISSTKMGAKK
ncbi:MAG: hypothetical protein FWG55_02990 [Candidatus Bathyarchaeota archaeon]|nr:hypothetical protein [Candidatus Termiticorpusculum sp.]